MLAALFNITEVHSWKKPEVAGAVVRKYTEMCGFVPQPGQWQTQLRGQCSVCKATVKAPGGMWRQSVLTQTVWRNSLAFALKVWGNSRECQLGWLVPPFYESYTAQMGHWYLKYIFIKIQISF
jgi:hypothetical protein